MDNEIFEQIDEISSQTEEIQEENDIITSDSLGTDLPIEENNSQDIQSEIIYNIQSEIDLSSIQTLIETSNNNQTLILEKLDFITSVMYVVIISIVFHFCWKFIWGLFSNERF